MSLNKEIDFGEIKIPSDRPFLIAEAGVNHENSLDTACLMIEEAAKAGADAIKFQSYKAEKIVSRFSPSYWDLTKEPTKTQFELFRKYDHFGLTEYKKLRDKADECGIVFLSTPFDFDYAETLADLMPVFKIASADITNYPFLAFCARKQKPVILSVGASTIGEIEEAVRVIRNEGNQAIGLLHCVLSYPTDPADANLNFIPSLAALFPDCIIGYSDHVPPVHNCLALTAAWLKGARIIEKHFTLDKTKTGNDHYHAMDPNDIREIRKQCAFATSISGGYQKKVLDCEKESRKQARRSLVAKRFIRKGELIQACDLDIKRPGTGLEPRFLSQVSGSFAVRDIPEDQLLQWEDIISRKDEG